MQELRLKIHAAKIAEIRNTPGARQEVLELMAKLRATEKEEEPG